MVSCWSKARTSLRASTSGRSHEDRKPGKKQRVPLRISLLYRVSAVSCGFHVPGKVKIASHLSEP